MAFSYLKEDNLASKFNDAVTYTDGLTKPFIEWERIANNRPSLNRDQRYSDVTDGTTSSVIRKLGKRIVQQIPTGVVEVIDDDDWHGIIAEFVYENKILPYANIDYDIIQKSWQMIERGAITGSQLIYTPFVNNDGEFTADMTLPHWGDVIIPRGSKAGKAHKYFFIRQWWQDADFDEVINREKQLEKSAKERGEKYKSLWDLKALELARDMTSSKQTDKQDVTERERNIDTSGVQVITGFQMGYKATFYTFVMGSDESNDSEVTILKRKINKDPRGKYPASWYYNDTDGFNPLGRSIVELIGPMQNLIDSDMQAYQWNRALMLAPPLTTRSVASKKRIVYEPNAIIDLGDDPNALVKPLDVDTSAVINYPDLYGLQKSQLLNLVNSPDTSISSDVGNPGFGKTPQALSMQQQTISVDDNYVRKNFEAAFEAWSEDAINVYFAERTGKEVLQLDDKTAKRLRDLAKEGKFDESLLNDNDEIIIDYDEVTPILKFKIDASTTKVKEDANQSDVLKEILNTIASNPLLSQIIPQEKIIEIYNRLVTSTSVEDPEDLSIDIKEFKQQQQAAMAQQQMQANQQQQMTLEQSEPTANESQEPMAEQSTDMHPEEAQIAQMLQEMNVPDDYIAQAIKMIRKGYSADDVLTAINGVLQHA